MELSLSLMVLDQDVNGQERGTTAGQEKKAGVTSPVAEIAMMTITGKEAVNERDIVIVIEIVIENVTENESIAIVREAEGRGTPCKDKKHSSWKDACPAVCFL